MPSVEKRMTADSSLQKARVPAAGVEGSAVMLYWAPEFIAPDEREDVAVLFAGSQPRIDHHCLVLRRPAAASHATQIREARK